MRKRCFKFFTIVAAVLLVSGAVIDDANARAGGGKSSGSRGSRSFSPNNSKPSQSGQQFAPQQSSPSPQSAPYQQSVGGGFLRSFGGAMLGGMVGGMLFRSLGFGGMGATGGGGIGIFEILLIAGIGYMIYRVVKNNRENNLSYSKSGDRGRAQLGNITTIHSQPYQPEVNDLVNGLAYIRQMDPSFDETRFKDNVMDLFFKIQGAWMNRDLAPVSGLLTEEMSKVFKGDIDNLLSEKRVNRLENIAVRKVEIEEVWQEAGQDYITTLIYANLLDYTTDDTTGQVVAGSKTEPVKFEEYWTFSRSVGNNSWKLSAINQK